jgi:hypothetical protein
MYQWVIGQNLTWIDNLFHDTAEQATNNLLRYPSRMVKILWVAS